LRSAALAADETGRAKADYSLHIATGLIELSPRHVVSPILYNGQFPGPLLRFKEGQPVVVDIHNDTDTPELLHWHAQRVAAEVAGAGFRRLNSILSPITPG
jgi:FtsP/CotA-like multicopper oxidase with cupredoxin domain